MHTLTTSEITAALTALELPVYETQLLASIGDHAYLSPGTQIAALAAPRRVLTVMLSGTAVATRTSGDTYALDATYAPVIIGELTVLRHRLWQTADVYTTSESHVLTVPGAVFDRVADRLPVFTERITTTAAGRLAAAESSDAARTALRKDAVKAYHAALARLG
jgi:signal-transduction protein with cAMP-binding, CBS, and nucleotidyltransferase domain